MDNRVELLMKRQECFKKMHELFEAINSELTLNSFSESQWDNLQDHLEEDLQLIHRYNEFKKNQIPTD